MNIYVGNLPYDVREDELKSLFDEFGTVTSARVVTDGRSGRSKGFGFVEMESKEGAQAAIDALNESDFKGRPLRVNEARPRPEGGSGGGESRGNFGGGERRGGFGGGGYGRGGNR